MTHKNSVPGALWFAFCLLLLAAVWANNRIPRATNVSLRQTAVSAGAEASSDIPRTNTGDSDSQQTFQFEHEFAWAQFTWSYSQKQWCVNAQRRDAKPGEFVGGCWPTFEQAERGVMRKSFVGPPQGADK